MTAVHYFQRYSQKENVATNNTLLLLSRVQVHDPRKLKALLEELLCETEEETFQVGVQFSQQTAATGSVPDGTLYQSSFRVVVETKRGPDFSSKQLAGHLSAFGSEDTKVLLLLSPHRTVIAVPEARERGVRVVSRTFQEIVAACRGVGLQEDLELRELVEDYEAFCLESGLVSHEDERIMAVAVGATLAENMELGLYYAPVSRGFQRHRFVGLCKDKAMRAVGELTNLVEADLVGGQLKVHKSTVPLTREEEERIRKAIELAPRHGYSIARGHRFFLVSEFVPTSFRKTSKGGLLGKRYFNVRDELGLQQDEPLPTVAAVAAALRNRSWE